MAMIETWPFLLLLMQMPLTLATSVHIVDISSAAGTCASRSVAKSRSWLVSAGNAAHTAVDTGGDLTCVDICR